MPTTKPDFCKGCPINSVTTGYVPPLVVPGSQQLLVGEAAGENEANTGLPFVGGAGNWLEGMLRNAGKQDRKDFNIINTIGCQPPKNVYPGDNEWPEWTGISKETSRKAIDYCYKHHFEPFVSAQQWRKIVALGEKALNATTGKRGISLWRGSPLQSKWAAAAGLPPNTIATLHPAALMRQATMYSACVRDLRKPLAVPPENYTLYPTLSEVREYAPKVVSFDFEWDRDGNITLCGFSDKLYQAIVVPFEGEFIAEIRRIIEGATDLIGHNIIGADTTYFARLGWDVRAKLWDTMLMQHLVQPDYKHGLNVVASVFTNKVFWKGRGSNEDEEEGGNVQWKTWDKAWAIPRAYGGYGGCASADEAFRLYNARDTDGSLQCYFPIRQLLERYDLEKLYWNVSVPLGHICKDIAEQGLKIDAGKLLEIQQSLDSDIERLEAKLPEELAPRQVTVWKQRPAPPGAVRPKTITCKGTKKAPHAPREWTFLKPPPFEALQCSWCQSRKKIGKFTEAKIERYEAIEIERPYKSPQKMLQYVKEKELPTKINRKTGRPTTDKNARKSWAKADPAFLVLNELSKATTLKNSFAKEELLHSQRMYFNLLVHGTSEGRLSSTGRRKGIDLQIQNQPKVIRKIFVPDEPGQGILNLDLVQGENMLTAWLAKDWVRWERLHTPGFDEHSYMAHKFFNVSLSDCSKGGKHEEYRKPGKIINHGRNYGLGARTTVEYLAAEGLTFSEKDVKEMIAIWEQENKATAAWQARTIKLAEQQGYLTNPFGRKRWFTYNTATKALAFLPASTLADCVLRMMIACYPERFMQELQAEQVRVYATLLEGWRLAIQVHDSLVAIGNDATHIEQARSLHAIMTQPWLQLDGFAFKVDVEYSTKSWGDCKAVEI